MSTSHIVSALAGDPKAEAKPDPTQTDTGWGDLFGDSKWLSGATGLTGTSKSSLGDFKFETPSFAPTGGSAFDIEFPAGTWDADWEKTLFKEGPDFSKMSDAEFKQYGMDNGYVPGESWMDSTGLGDLFTADNMAAFSGLAGAFTQLMGLSGNLKNQKMQYKIAKHNLQAAQESQAQSNASRSSFNNAKRIRGV